jgi:hypothetical protein
MGRSMLRPYVFLVRLFTLVYVVGGQDFGKDWLGAGLISRRG